MGSFKRKFENISNIRNRYLKIFTVWRNGYDTWHATELSVYKQFNKPFISFSM